MLRLHAPAQLEADARFKTLCVWVLGSIATSSEVVFSVDMQDSCRFEFGGRSVSMPCAFDSGVAFTAVKEYRTSANDPLTLPCAFSLRFGTGAQRADGGDLSWDFNLFAEVFHWISLGEERLCADRDGYNRVDHGNNIKVICAEYPFVDALVEAVLVTWLGAEKVVVAHKNTVIMSCDLDWPVDPLAFSPLRALQSAPSKVPAALWRGLTGFNWAQLPQDRFYKALIFEAQTCHRFGNRLDLNLICLGTSYHDFTVDLGPYLAAVKSNLPEDVLALGLHLGFNTCDNLTNARRSSERFAAVAEIADFALKRNRQHFLRWDPMRTPSILSAIGVDRDTSIGFPDQPGFRAGTLRDFPLYDPTSKIFTAITCEPLVIMESTILDRADLSFDEKRAVFYRYTDLARERGERLSILWHNSRLVDSTDRELFESVLSYGYNA